jgi:hypothetical protein
MTIEEKLEEILQCVRRIEDKLGLSSGLTTQQGTSSHSTNYGVGPHGLNCVVYPGK